MNNKTKRLLAMLLTIVMCFATLAPTMAFAETETDPTIVYWEDFAGETLNSSGNDRTIIESNGIFAKTGFSLDTSKGVMKYETGSSDPFVDIRFRRGSKMEKNLMQDFVFSFKLTPAADGLNTEIAMRGEHEQSGTVTFYLSEGGYPKINGQKAAEAIPGGVESQIDIAFHYNPEAVPSNSVHENGAIDSCTVYVNGTAVLENVALSVKVKNFDYFRCFRYANGAFEVDDIVFALGNEPLYGKNLTKADDYTQNFSWLTEKEPVTDYAYSFCVVGDTQIVTAEDVTDSENNLSKIYDWIVANADDKKMAHVFGLGDITDNNKTAEWEHAKTEIDKLNGVVPYSLVRGNHDGLKTEEVNINNYFYKDNAAYTDQFEEFYSDTMANSYRRFFAGNEKYLLLTLEYCPSDDELTWANGIIEKYSDHKVIITTHAYLSKDGDPLSLDEVGVISTDGSANAGQEMWNTLISQHENIFLVLSGHIDVDYVVATQQVGKYGNTVTQMLINPQKLDEQVAASGMVTMLYFSEDGSIVDVETYSTVRGEYFLTENQFQMNLSATDTPITYQDFSSGTVNTDFNQVGSNGGFVFQAGKSTWNADDQCLNITSYGPWDDGDPQIQLQLYNAGHANNSTVPMNRDFSVSFKLRMNADNQNMGDVRIRDTEEGKSVTLFAMNNNGVYVGGTKYAEIKVGEWTEIEVVFNYDEANQRFASFTLLKDSVELSTFVLDSGAATLSYINHIWLFRYGGEGANFSVDDIDVGFGIGNRGTGVASKIYDNDFEEMTDANELWNPSTTPIEKFRVYDCFKGHSKVGNGILSAIKGTVTGKSSGYVDVNNDASFGHVGAMTLSMKIRPIGTGYTNDSFIQVFYDGGSQALFKFANAQNAIKVGDSTVTLSSYRFSTVEVMFRYDYANMCYISADLYVNGEYIGSAAFTQKNVKWFRMFKTYVDDCGMDIDSISVVTGCQSLYEGETAVTEFIGYQATEADTTNNYNVRLLAIMTDADIEKYKNVGFKVSISFAGNGITVDLPVENGVCTSVYESVLASAGIETTYTAATLGGKGIFALNCLNLSTDYGDATFTVTTYYTLADAENAVEERTFEFTVTSSDLPKGGVN